VQVHRDEGVAIRIGPERYDGAVRSNLTWDRISGSGAVVSLLNSAHQSVAGTISKFCLA
jgi:hypothetical protein